MLGLKHNLLTPGDFIDPDFMLEERIEFFPFFQYVKDRNRIVLEYSLRIKTNSLMIKARSINKTVSTNVNYEVQLGKPQQRTVFLISKYASLCL